ncbi:MAG: YceI family protein [Actinomycetota bacterium]|nr:YceI family protein [Actinomycetota bacterium]
MSQITAELSGKYAIDPSHSRIGFSARHAMVTKVRGGFNEFEGSGVLDGGDVTKSSLQVTIKAASIDTRNADRDNHIRSNDFLALDEYPEITFTSTGIEAVGGDKFRANGDLTVRGVTRPVTFDLEFTGTEIDPWGNRRIGVEGSTVINRKDFGVSWNAALESGGILVSENVTLEFEISAVKQG